MCNLYSITTNQAAISALFRVVNRYVGNLAPMPGVFPDYKAPIVRNGAEGRELATARWGMPSSSKALMDATKKRAEKLQAKGKPVDFKELLRMEPDGGTTNIRNVKSKHWARWLDVENRCVVPFNSFSEFNKAEGGDVWFALDETRPLACFAGIWTNWTSVRKVKEGETTNDLYAFLTTEPNTEVGVIHPKAMPVILTTPDEVESWMTAPPDEALKLQRQLPDQMLRIVARGIKEDPPGPGRDGQNRRPELRPSAARSSMLTWSPYATSPRRLLSFQQQPTNRRDWLMSPLQKTIADKFLAKLAEDEEFNSKKIEQITDLLAADKKPKADDFAKVFASDDAGDIE